MWRSMERVVLRQHFKREDGAAALEFGLLGLIFFGFLLFLIDLGLFFGVRTIADKAVSNVARQIRVGALDPGDQVAFRDILCSELIFLRCDRFTYTVISDDNLMTLIAEDADGNVSIPAVTLDDDGNITNPNFDIGDPEDYVIITISYVHRFIFPLIGDFFGDDGLNDSQSFAIISHLVTKNEPFPANAPAPPPGS